MESSVAKKPISAVLSKRFLIKISTATCDLEFNSFDNCFKDSNVRLLIKDCVNLANSSCVFPIPEEPSFT